MLISNISSTIFTAAEAYFALGYSVIPLWGDKNPDRAKVAAVPWSDYQQNRPSLVQLQRWFVEQEFPGLAIVTGAISRLAVLDFDTSAGFCAFKSRFPALAETHVVQTRRGFHIYYRIPSNMHVPSHKGQGIDLLSDGCYVVARPSTIAGHTYKLVQGGQPYLLSIPDMHHILSFIDEQGSHQSRVSSFQFSVSSHQPSKKSSFSNSPHIPRPISLSSQHLSSSYRYHAVREGRNRALFRASLTARDEGWPLERTRQALMDLHVNQCAYDQHITKSPDMRHLEAEKTICSAYSRPPRAPKIAQTTRIASPGLPNTVRESLFQRKNTHAVRLWEGLNLKGIQPGALFTAEQAVTTLRGIVGRDSIYNALNLTVNGEAFFERLSPSRHPQASSDAATNTEKEIPTKCVFGRAKKSGINLRGPKTRRFIMPAPLDWCRILGVQTQHSDPLTVEDLSSAKTTRMAAHRELIKRRPGIYPRRWLANRLGVRVETIDTYNAEIPIQRRPQYSEKRIYWSIIRVVPDDMQIDGAFLEDLSGKRYPAKRAIAAKLLAQGKSLIYKRQDANYYWYGDSLPDLGVLYGLPPRADDPVQGRAGIQNFDPPPQALFDRSRGVQLNAPTQPPASVHDSSALKTAKIFSGTELQSPNHSPFGGLGFTGSRTALASGGGNAPASPSKPKRLPSGRRPLKNADHEALACRVVERVNRLSEDAARHISIAVVRRLVSQYDHALIERTLALLEARRNIAKPAGFFVTVLRSESKRQVVERLACEY